MRVLHVATCEEALSAIRMKLSVLFLAFVAAAMVGMTPFAREVVVTLLDDQIDGDDCQHSMRWFVETM